ncbi:signal peptide, CUB and EGF-like domain-containing protein 2 [Tachypleus tridentatus]|uniref:signal peptide, CUB and EGF-like domain-containing protein 2 n=1 Tax=Tachypleus tridentatus TaxID=6853 RepID=UPI003FD50743
MRYCLQKLFFGVKANVYVPAENLTCTRGYRRDADRSYPCPPGHYNNGLQTFCLPCPGGTYMAHFASDNCIPCPGDKITDEEGADNTDLCRNPTEVVPKATLPSVSKSTVTRYAWWIALISICLIALCLVLKR